MVILLLFFYINFREEEEEISKDKKNQEKLKIHYGNLDQRILELEVLYCIKEI